MKERIDLGEVENRIINMGGGEMEIWKKSLLSDDTLFQQIYQLTFNRDHKIAWRSCYILDNADESSHGKLKDKLPELVQRLSTERDSSIKRHFTRIISRYDLEEEQLGPMVDIAFRLLSPMEDVAVRANAMKILFRISEHEPDLKGELAAFLETILEEDASPGIISISKKLLKKLRAEHYIKLKK